MYHVTAITNNEYISRMETCTHKQYIYIFLYVATCYMYHAVRQAENVSIS